MHGGTGIHGHDARSPERRAWRIAAVAIVALGGVVRILSARGDLWLDEIWSVVLAREAASVARILGSIHHDNNHYLSTLWMFLLGEPTASWLYRLPSVAAGTATIAIAALRPLRYGRLEALTSALLLALCPLLVQYDSEARGYAPAALFAVVGFHALDRLLSTGGWRPAALLAAAAVLGILSHLTYLFALAGFGAWAALELLRTHAPRMRWTATALAFTPSLLVLVALWSFDLRHFIIGGGPEYRIADVLRELVRGVFGLPAGAAELAALPFLAVAAAGAIRFARDRDPRAAFFAVAIVLAPAAILVFSRPQFLAARYFFVVVPFVLMLLSAGLSAMASTGGRGRRVHALAAAAFCVAAALPDARLVAHGRGRYADAVAFMRASTPEDTVTVGTDNDFRNGMLLDYYAGHPPGGKPVVVVPQGSWRENPPRWFLIHDLADRPAPPPAVEVWSGQPYALAGAFPRTGLSGWHWYVLRRVERSPR